MSTPIKPLNAHLAFAKTVFSHAAVFSKSEHKQEREYAERLQSFISKAAKILGVEDEKSDFSIKLFTSLVERNVAAFRETYRDVEDAEIEPTVTAAHNMAKTNETISLPATGKSLPAFAALLIDIRHGFNDEDDLDNELKELEEGLYQLVVKLSDTYPKELPSAKDTFKSMLAVWSYGSKFWNLNNACGGFAGSLDGHLLHENGSHIKVWGTDAFSSLALQHLTDPSADLNIPVGNVAYGDAISNLPSLSSIYSHLNNVVVRDSRDVPSPIASDPWVVMRLVNELHDRIVCKDSTEFRDINGHKVDPYVLEDFKEKFSRMSKRFNNNFVSAMPLYQKYFSVIDYGNGEAYEKLGM